MNKLLCYRVSIIAVLYVGYAFYSLTRKSISFMMPHFTSNTYSNSSHSLNITKSDIGIIISSLNFAYAMSKFLCGILSDVASCRILFGAGLFISGLLNIGLKKEIKVHNLYSLSFFIGLAQGPAWPACAKILRNWVPESQFATWWTVLSTSANVAGALGPFVATFIALKYHWSIGFMILGCICMSVGYLSIIILRNKPGDIQSNQNNENAKRRRKKRNETELAKEITAQTIVEDINEEETITRFQQTKLMLKYPYFLLICLAFFLIQLVKTLVSDVAQVYLIKVINVNPYSASYFLTGFELAGVVGSIASGIASDYIFHLRNKKRLLKHEKLLESPIQTRFQLITVMLILLMGCLHVFNFHLAKGATDLFIISIGSLAGIFCYGSHSLLGVVAMEFTAKEYSGTSHAIASLAANFGAIAAGIPFSLISKYYSWNIGFKMVELAAMCVVLLIIIFRNSCSNFVPATKLKTQ